MIVTTQHTFRLPPAERSPEEAYGLAQQAIGALAQLRSEWGRWHDLPRSSSDPGARFDDRASMLARMAEDAEKKAREFPQLPVQGASISVTTGVGRDWRRAGRADLSIDPAAGRAVFRLREPDKAFGDQTASLLRASLVSLVNVLQPVFANNDVKVRQQGELMTYQFDQKLYPHREFLGWMGFVPAQLRQEQLRDAHEVLPVEGRGSVVVAVPGMFNPADPAQVAAVHRVEMQLAHFELLPVTDPALGQ